MIINTLVLALMAYGLVGLRNEASAIFTFMAINSLQGLVSSQLLITCVWITPTAVRPAVVCTRILAASRFKLVF